MKEQGFTIFIAMVIMGTLLLISSSIVNLAVKQSFISSAGRDSQYAFYAADTGIECALFWDVKNPYTEVTAFSASSPYDIFCNNSGIGFEIADEQPGYVRFEYELYFAPDPYCALVKVAKGNGSTTIESLGYNTCDTSNPRRVERAIRVNY